MEFIDLYKIDKKNMSNQINEMRQTSLRDSPVLMRVPESNINSTQQVIVRS